MLSCGCVVVVAATDVILRDHFYDVEYIVVFPMC